MKRHCVKMLAGAAALAAAGMLWGAEDEGWRNVCASRRMPEPVRGIWQAPLAKGAEAFAVEWRGGATGTVAFVSTSQGKKWGQSLLIQ